MSKLEKTVKDCAREVYHTLGAGYMERAYAEALMVEFRLHNIEYETQRDVEILYKGHKIGTSLIDLIVKGKPEIVIELKAASKLTTRNIEQTASYLRTYKMKRGLLINFPYPYEEEPEFQVVEA